MQQSRSERYELRKEEEKARMRAYYLARKDTPEFKEYKRLRQAKRRSNPELRENEYKQNRERRAIPEGWALAAITRIKYRAAKNGLDFNIDVGDLLPLPTTCPALGIPIVLTAKKGGWVASPNAPSVDRFDNKLGYIKGNVRIISTRANILKKDATAEELRGLAAYASGG